MPKGEGDFRKSPPRIVILQQMTLEAPSDFEKYKA